MPKTITRLLFAFHYRCCAMWNVLIPSVTLDGRKLRVLPTVYKPLENEHRLVDWIDEGKTVLDLGCGSGVLTVFAALKSKHVTALDINPEAVENTRLNCEAQGLENVTAEVSDMFGAVDDRYDYIISCPPFFRLALASSHQQWATSTYFVDALFENARNYLRQDGRLVVLLPQSYRPEIERLAKDDNLDLVSTHPHPSRSLRLILHGLPYLHFGMDCRVFTFAATEPALLRSVPPSIG